MPASTPDAPTSGKDREGPEPSALDVEKSHSSGVGVVYHVTDPDDPHRTATVTVLPDGTAWGLVSDWRRYGDEFVDAAREAVVKQGCAEVPDDA